MTPRAGMVSALAVAGAASVLTGCGFSGLADQSLPLSKGSGRDALHATVYLADAANLVPNAEVKVNDITVGSVRKVTFDHWRAKVSIALEPGTRVPADATASVAQKSLLGAEYLELAAPAAASDSSASASAGVLSEGAVIPLSQTSRYPETEEVLSSLSLVLNGGGLEKVSTITRELNRALGGREQDWRRVVDELEMFVTVLDRQRQDIVRALERLDVVGRTFADQRDDLDTALERLPKGVDTLADERKRLTSTLSALSSFSDTASDLVETSGKDLDANLTSLRPVLTRLSDAGSNLTQALGDLRFPFPLKGANVAIQGDYLNFFATFDLTTDSLTRDFLAGTPLEGVYAGLTGSLPSATSTKSTDPLREPLKRPSGTDEQESSPEVEKPTGKPVKSLLDHVFGLLGGGDDE
jgi:phospholipid/cholesterol/gamma-HCH transport system substrate-binding protein